MFRSRKKKIHSGSRRIVRTFSDDDDENDTNEVGTTSVRTDEEQILDSEDSPSALLIALQQRKAEKRNKKKAKTKRKIGGSGPVVRSFDIEEADDNGDGDQIERKKKKKRKRGLGFGGGNNTVDFDDNARSEDGMGSLATNTYGREALEQLKSEQRRQTAQAPQAPLQSTPSRDKEHLNGDPRIIKNHDESHNPPEESFISLEDQGEGNDLSGDNYSPKKEQDKEKIFVVDDPPPDESHGWERQIEQRAGIKASSRLPESSNTKLLSLGELSQNLKSTVETIGRQREELENSTNRLRADREHAMANSKEHQERLKKTGLACEFYQSTRRDLTLWVGALRDLQEKVRQIAAGFGEMLQIQAKDFNHEFRMWQDDCVATLYQTHRLDRVLGRQPESTLLTTASNEIVLDEFGRDIGSQYLRDREFRFKTRDEYINRTEDGNENSFIKDGLFKREDHDEEERSKILHEALSAAIEDLDQEYTSAKQLKSIFDHWFVAHFDDYQQCFATLSFGDLYAVLVQVDLCKSSFFPDVLLSKKDSTKDASTSSNKITQRSILEIDHCFLEQKHKEKMDAEKQKVAKVALENDGRLARAIEKGVLPMLVKILMNDEDEHRNNSFYIFYSTSKSMLVSKLINDAAIRPLRHGESCSINHKSSNGSSKALSSNLRQQVQNLVSTAIKKTLDSISIPLLNKDGDKLGFHNDGDRDENKSSLSSQSNALDCSVKFARVYLVHILQQTLCNIILHWFPLIDIDTNLNSSSDDQAENGIHCVLNFINDKYLVLLSSIEKIEEASSEKPLSAGAFFKPIWEALNKESKDNIIESPSLMLMTMPLRAAARAYQLN